MVVFQLAPGNSKSKNSHRPVMPTSFFAREWPVLLRLPSLSCNRLHQDMLLPSAIHIFIRGMYLTDLTFVEDGNPNRTGGLINFRKRQLEYNIMVDILQFQDKSYDLKIV